MSLEQSPMLHLPFFKRSVCRFCKTTTFYISFPASSTQCLQSTFYSYTQRQLAPFSSFNPPTLLRHCALVFWRSHTVNRAAQEASSFTTLGFRSFNDKTPSGAFFSHSHLFTWHTQNPYSTVRDFDLMGGHKAIHTQNINSCTFR